MNKLTLIILLFLFCSTENIICSEDKSSFTTFLQSQKMNDFKNTTCLVAKKGVAATTWAITSTVQYIINKEQCSANQATGEKSLAYAENSDSDSDSESEFSKIQISRNSFFRDQSELQASLGDDVHKTIRKLNTVTVDYFNKENPENLSVQKDMLHTFTLLQESSKHGKTVALDPAIADNHNQLQLNLLIAAIRKHANIIEPEFEMVYQTAKTLAENDQSRRIEAANKKFETAMQKANAARLRSLNRSKSALSTFASNSQYLNSRATRKQDHGAHDLAIFNDPESYKLFLDDSRKQQEPIAVLPEDQLQLHSSKNKGGRGKNKAHQAQEAY